MASSPNVVRERILKGYQDVSNNSVEVAPKEKPVDFLDTPTSVSTGVRYSAHFPGAVEYLAKAGKPDFDISSLLHDVSEWSEEAATFIPEVDQHYKWQHEVLYPCVMGLIKGMKMLTVGPTGSGKTTFHENLAGMLTQPFYRLGGRGDMESDTILGRQHIENGTMSFVLGEFTKAYTQGFYILLDEAWKLPANINMTFQRVFERNGLLQIDEAQGDLKDKQFHPAVSTIIQLADNVVGTGDGADKYAATMIQDGSTINRMDMILHLGYLKPQDEVEMLLSRFGTFLPERVAKQMVQLAGLVRDGFEDGHVSATMSPRNLFTWLEMAETCRDYAEAYRWTMLQRYADDSERATVAGFYQTTFGQTL
jgi:cobaltochelatase CobS